MELLSELEIKKAIQKEKDRKYGAEYRAKKKEAISARNKLYFDRKKEDIEFLKMRRTSSILSSIKRGIENRKGDEGMPVRPYVRVILNPENVKYIVYVQKN